MNFLAMVIALGLQQVLPADNVLQRRAWALDWSAFVFQSVPWRAASLLLSLAVPLVAAHWLLGLSSRWLFGLPELLFTAAIFIWALGRDDFHTSLERYEALNVAGDQEGATRAVAGLWLPPESDQAAAPSSHDRALERLAYSGFSRWFAPLLYFLLLGPLGAVAYRLLRLYAEQGQDPAYILLLRWADWLPAKALGLSFALLGDFLAVIGDPGLRSLWDVTPAHRQLRAEASAACGEGYSARSLGALLYRCAGLWLLAASLIFILF